MEEYGEMVQAMSKVRRDKDTILHVIEEATDLLIVTYSWLVEMGVSDETMEKFFTMKENRAVERYLDHAEQ